MKKAFILTSVIDPDNSYPLTYSKVRSFFTAEERERQTIMTINSLDHLSDPDTVIFMLEISENSNIYREKFWYQKNLVFISVKEQFPEIYYEVKSHPNKSRCETLLLESFMRKYKKELSEFDYFFKISGRYFLDSSFDTSLFNEYNKDKIFFKKALSFEWQDHFWVYDIVDRREAQGDNCLRQYCTTIFGWGKDHYDHFLDMFTVTANLLKLPRYHHLDIETFLYLFTRAYEKDIIETDWITYGWTGADGRFLRY